jgi:hypothetical protein
MPQLPDSLIRDDLGSVPLQGLNRIVHTLLGAPGIVPSGGNSDPIGDNTVIVGPSTGTTPAAGSLLAGGSGVNVQAIVNGLTQAGIFVLASDVTAACPPTGDNAPLQALVSVTANLVTALETNFPNL